MTALTGFFGAISRVLKTLFGPDGADIPEEWLRKQIELRLSDEEKAPNRGAGGLGQADGNTQTAPRRTAGTAPGWQQVDRHRRHITFRRIWL